MTYSEAQEMLSKYKHLEGSQFYGEPPIRKLDIVPSERAEVMKYVETKRLIGEKKAIKLLDPENVSVWVFHHRHKGVDVHESLEDFLEKHAEDLS